MPAARPTPEHFDADRAKVAPLVARLKAIDAAGALAAYDSGNSTELPNVHEIAEIDGRPAYVGVTAIMSESGDEGFEQIPGSENFLSACVFSTARWARISSTSISSPARPLHRPLRIVVGMANYALTNAAGQTVGWFTWQPDRPGALILSETLPAMIGALAIAGVVLLVLLRGLRRTTVALEEGKAAAEHQANHDVLTGLANRAHFNKRLEEALTASPRDNSSIALLALDLDRFKQVNDTLGHEAGDQLLREVGQRLSPLVDENDTVARLGGDEFAIIQRGVHATDEVSRAVGRASSTVLGAALRAGRPASRRSASASARSSRRRARPRATSPPRPTSRSMRPRRRAATPTGFSTTPCARPRNSATRWPTSCKRPSCRVQRDRVA